MEETKKTTVETSEQEVISKLKESGRLYIYPCKIGSMVYVDSGTLPTDKMGFKTAADIPLYFSAKVVSFRQNSKGKFVKVKVRTKWLHEWIDPETGPDSAYYETEKYFTYPLSAFGKTIFLSNSESERKLKGVENADG